MADQQHVRVSGQPSIRIRISNARHYGGQVKVGWVKRLRSTLHHVNRAGQRREMPYVE
jgi:hypothetical protein